MLMAVIVWFTNPKQKNKHYSSVFCTIVPVTFDIFFFAFQPPLYKDHVKTCSSSLVTSVVLTGDTRGYRELVLITWWEHSFYLLSLFFFHYYYYHYYYYYYYYHYYYYYRICCCNINLKSKKLYSDEKVKIETRTKIRLKVHGWI